MDAFRKKTLPTSWSLKPQETFSESCGASTGQSSFWQHKVDPHNIRIRDAAGFTVVTT